MSQRHPFHLVDPSPMPLVTSTAAFITVSSGVAWFHGYDFGGFSLFLSLILLTICMFIWWRDVIREGTFEGHHTQVVQLGLRYGMMLFIASEVMFFFAFFWAFFTASLSPTIEIGGVFPPKGIAVFNAWEVPFLNTLLLLSSGVTVTWAHHAILAGSRTQTIQGLVATIVFAVLFTCLQGFEYCTSLFSISDGVYGSTFFMATGFHGFHVIIGTSFLTVCLVRAIKTHFTQDHHFGFEAAAWYWHFVDVVWLFLFVVVYVWGGL